MMYAVAPGLFAPLQSLLAFLPQIALMLLAAATALFRPQAYRWAWGAFCTHRRWTAPAALLLLAAGAWAWKGRPAKPPPPPPTTEEMRDGWWCFRRDAGRSGSDGSAVPARVAVAWKHREGLNPQPFTSSPAVWAGRVYVGNDVNAVFCFDASGAEDPLWITPTRHPVFSSPAVAGGRVFVGEGLHHHNDARLYCLDALTGETVWKFQTTGHVECTPSVAGGRVFFGAGDDGVYCADAATGARIWQAKGMHVDGSPLLVKGLVVVGAGYGRTGVGAYRAADGVPAWFTPLPASAWGPPALGPRGVIVGIGNGNFEVKQPDPRAEIVCLSLEGGGIVWRAPLRDAVLAAAAVSGDRVFLGDRSGDFHCFNAVTGERLWTAGCGWAVLSSAAIASNAVVYGCDGGHVHARRPEDGTEIWKFEAKDAWNTDRRIMSSPAVAGGRVYVGCNNFFFYCLGPAK